MPFSAKDFRFLEEVGVEACAGVEDLDTDEAVAFPVQDDERLDAWTPSGGVAGMLVRPRVSRWPVRWM
jgi:hypothetical protein